MKGLDTAAGGSPNTPKHRRSQKGQEDALRGCAGWQRPRPLHTEPEGGGGARAQRSLPPAGSRVGVWEGDGGRQGRGPHASHNPAEGRRVHAGPDWKQMGPPCQVPDTRGGGGGGWRGPGGGGAAPRRQPIPAGAAAPSGFENSVREAGRPSGSRAPGKQRGTPAGPEPPQGGRSPLCSDPWGQRFQLYQCSGMNPAATAYWALRVYRASRHPTITLLSKGRRGRKITCSRSRGAEI